MTAVEFSVVSQESAVVKMEDRKRPAADSNESAPPSKKQATTVNGTSKPHPDADMPWRDDLEVGFQICVFTLRKPSRACLRDVYRKWFMESLLMRSAIAFSKRCHPTPNARIQA